MRPEKAQDYAFYVQNSINFNDLTLTPGLRYEKYKLKTYKGSGANISKYSYEFDKFMPSFSFDYEIGAGFGVFTSYSKVFSGPEMMEAMAVNRAKDYPVNKNLKATTGDNYEFGTRYKAYISNDINLNLTAKYFKSKYKNLIAMHKNNASRINVGGADIDGFEVFARTNLYNASLAFGYTKQDIKYKDRVLQPSKKEYYRSDLLGHRDSGDKYTFNAEYALSSFDLLFGYNLLYFASQSVDEAQGFEKVNLPSYCVSDFYVTYAPLSGKFKGLEINAGIYNAFDKAYSAHSQRNKDFYDKSNQFAEWEAGRNFKINLSYKF
ncbi:MAG: TonB-dependent receptor domain-containing protein [Campylobacter sp.]